MEAFEIIQTIETASSQSGTKFLRIKTEAGKTYSLWPPSEGQEKSAWEDRGRLQPGIEVRLDYEQKGQYKNITAWEMLGEVKRTTPSLTNDLAIVREVCLKAAVELAKANIESGVEMKSDAVLRVAKAFEDWVIRE